MNQRTARANCFDASALVKVFANEPDSEAVRTYFHAEPTKYTTPFCFYETLNILKSKWVYRNELDRDAYLARSYRLAVWYQSAVRHVNDLDFTDPTVFDKAKELVRRTNLDLSDAFQILSIQRGYFSHMARDSQTVLVTADRGLAAAARTEGLRVWSTTEEVSPT